MDTLRGFASGKLETEGDLDPGTPPLIAGCGDLETPPGDLLGWGERLGWGDRAGWGDLEG